MRLLFTICGRAGSKGIKSKNCSDFLGVPLAYYTLAAVELYKELRPEVECRVALNTDSGRLRGLFDESGVDYLYVERDAALAGDFASKVDVIRDTLCRASGEGPFDYVVDLDITSPLRTAGDVDRVVERRRASGADTVFTMVPSRRSPYFNMVEDAAGGLVRRVVESDYLARQQAPATYDMNASIYAYRPGFLESGRQIFEGSCEGVIMKDTAVLDLDGPEDFELMQVVARHLFDANGGLCDIARRAGRMAAQRKDNAAFEEGPSAVVPVFDFEGSANE